MSSLRATLQADTDARYAAVEVDESAHHRAQQNTAHLSWSCVEGCRQGSVLGSAVALVAPVAVASRWRIFANGCCWPSGEVKEVGRYATGSTFPEHSVSLEGEYLTEVGGLSQLLELPVRRYLEG